MEAKIQEILEFWFGSLDQPVPVEKKKMWWTKSDATDGEIRTRFEETLQAAARGEYDAWKETPQGALALILLFDQFSRNIYRGTPQAFAQDHLALELARSMVESGQDQALPTLQRTFVYMPFEHAEDLDAQRRCLDLFACLVEDAPATHKEQCLDYHGYAQRHHEIIERFGRFPHRNKILGRDSTPEEVEFLKQPGSSF